jgi:hypothetical protein
MAAFISSLVLASLSVIVFWLADTAASHSIAL